ncbi:MAG: type II secretion system major pseudopilin GspG [Gammaproteobacteria bacterium]
MSLKKQSGFTLIEIMVVVVILGILAALIVPKIMERPNQARVVKTKQDILAIQDALDLYKLDNGFYPSMDQGLKALVIKPETTPAPMNWKTGGYLARLPIDPWNQAYQYMNPGIHNPNGVDIYTYNGSSGQHTEQNMIGNWNLENN